VALPEMVGGLMFHFNSPKQVSFLQ